MVLRYNCRAKVTCVLVLLKPFEVILHMLPSLLQRDLDWDRICPRRQTPSRQYKTDRFDSNHLPTNEEFLRKQIYTVRFIISS